MTAKIPKKYRGDEIYDERSGMRRLEYRVPVGEYPENYVFDVPLFCVDKGQHFDEVRIGLGYPAQLHYKNPPRGTRHKRYKLTETEVQDLYRDEMDTIEERYRDRTDRILDSSGSLFECRYADYSGHRMCTRYEWVWSSDADTEWVYPLSFDFLGAAAWNEIEGRHRVSGKSFECVSKKFEVPCIRAMLTHRDELAKLTRLLDERCGLRYSIPASLDLKTKAPPALLGMLAEIYEPAAEEARKTLDDAAQRMVAAIESEINDVVASKRFDCEFALIERSDGRWVAKPQGLDDEVQGDDLRDACDKAVEWLHLAAVEAERRGVELFQPRAQGYDILPDKDPSMIVTIVVGGNELKDSDRRHVHRLRAATSYTLNLP